MKNCTALLRWPRLLTGVHTGVRNLRLEPWTQTDDDDDDDEARVKRGRPAFKVIPTPHSHNIESERCLKYCSLGISYFTRVSALPGESKLRPGLGRLP